MIVTKYGVDVIVKYMLAVSIMIVGVLLFIPNDPLRFTIVGVVGVLTIFVLNFFRDPHRTTPQEEGIVVAPADGKIVTMKNYFESEYLQMDAVQLSIFMSPLDVHVNRFPISGIVEYFKHIPGEFGVAFSEKSSERNERTHIGIRREGIKILFKQIAGTVARRIVADLTVQQHVGIGERFGMIKFGSRVDVVMPKSVAVHVKLNDRVVAGETILARYGSPAVA